MHHRSARDEGPTGITVEDVAKRLIDFGFHAPTMSFPVGGTLMIEPTESESKGELDRFCDAMIAIREEIGAIELGLADPDDNPLENAPHTAEMIAAEGGPTRTRASRRRSRVAAVRTRKYWPPVGRVDNVYGDRNSSARARPCPSMSAPRSARGARGVRRKW